jgi:hypothetical protein
MKGERGERGEQGIQGIPGAQGEPGDWISPGALHQVQRIRRRQRWAYVLLTIVMAVGFWQVDNANDTNREQTNELQRQAKIDRRRALTGCEAANEDKIADRQLLVEALGGDDPLNNPEVIERLPLFDKNKPLRDCEIFVNTGRIVEIPYPPFQPTP